MSLIIKGSIMPLMCGDCPCYDGSDYACNATGRGVIEYRYDGRPDNCPIVEIPTPHGRLIDEEAIYNNVKSRCNNCHIRACAICGVTCILNDIRTAPTIIEAEVSAE